MSEYRNCFCFGTFTGDNLGLMKIRETPRKLPDRLFPRSCLKLSHENRGSVKINKKEKPNENNLY